MRRGRSAMRRREAWPEMETLPTILVIDDEPRSVEALERILEEEFDVFTATTV
ncbi:MAG TPA: response regulator transcription factor, partial [Chromatiaceae bacterium]|nr:response regulator transcription factor [Chromatiaceae bacterium]